MPKRTPAMPRAGKYNNRVTIVDGIRFASAREAARFAELRLMERAGEITCLRLQPRYELLAKFTDAQGVKHRSISYVADFEYRYKNGSVVVEDVKGVETDVFKLKAKFFKALYPEIALEIVR